MFVDFIPFKEDMVERDIEQALVKVTSSLLEELQRQLPPIADIEKRIQEEQGK